jgi:hypothetical protein
MPLYAPFYLTGTLLLLIGAFLAVQSDRYPYKRHYKWTPWCLEFGATTSYILLGLGIALIAIALYIEVIISSKGS